MTPEKAGARVRQDAKDKAEAEENAEQAAREEAENQRQDAMLQYFSHGGARRGTRQEWKHYGE